MTGLTMFCGLFSFTNVVAYGMFAFVFLQFFSISYSFCYTPLQSLYCVEILDYKARATGMAFEQLLINGLAYFQNYILANGAKDLGWKFFGFYVVIDFLAACTFWRYFPETKGKTLEEIEDIFADPRGPVKASLSRPRIRKSQIPTRQTSLSSMRKRQTTPSTGLAMNRLSATTYNPDPRASTLSRIAEDV